MARYIDSNKLEEWIKQNGDKLMGEYYIEHLKECSPEDVAPIIHAEWIEHEDWQEFQDADGNWDETRIVWYECSNCHKTEYDNDYEYCPHCGAKMDKEGVEMTKEEATFLLKQINEILINSNSWLENTHEPLNQALEMAIKALEQQPSEDKVSVEVYKQVSRERDIAIEQLKELGYGFGEKIRTSDDCVSRAEVNKLYDEYRPRLATHVSEFGDKLKALPSITPTETMPDNEQKVLVSPCFGRIF